MRPVDADAIYNKALEDLRKGEIEDWEADSIIDYLDGAHTINGAEIVVRCKDCKWFADNNGGEWYGCKMFHVVRITPEDAPKPDDFCSYGERREGGNDHVSD